MPSSPAFPRPMYINQNTGNLVDKGEKGMTLADFFAAHAPDDIPKWFIGPEPMARSTRPSPSDYFALDSVAIQVAREWMRDPCFDLEETIAEGYPDLRATALSFEQAMNSWWEEGERLGDINTEARYFAWRAFYGRRMAEEVAKEVKR